MKYVLDAFPFYPAAKCGACKVEDAHYRFYYPFYVYQGYTRCYKCHERVGRQMAKVKSWKAGTVPAL